jgi:hypothetical protein
MIVGESFEVAIVLTADRSGRIHPLIFRGLYRREIVDWGPFEMVGIGE